MEVIAGFGDSHGTGILDTFQNPSNRLIEHEGSIHPLMKCWVVLGYNGVPLPTLLFSRRRRILG